MNNISKSDLKRVLTQAGLINKIVNEKSEMPLFSYLSFDSGDIKPQTLFICKGASFQEKYAHDAISKGATALVSEKLIEGVSVPVFVVSDIREAMTVVATEFYKHSGIDKMRLVGITGTKGKTTVALMLASIMEQACKLRGEAGPAVISSVYTSDGTTKEEAHLTTPEAFEVYKILAKAASNGVRFGVVEVSSQALKVNRLGSLRFAIGVWLNIGEDHISPIEHPDFADYFDSKLRLFEHSDVAVINIDTLEKQAVVAKAQQTCAKTVEVGFEATKNPDYLLVERHAARRGQTLSVQAPQGEFEVYVPLIGAYNAFNALAALTVAKELQIDIDSIVKGLSQAYIPGRSEVLVSADERVVVCIDYAHNTLSFETFLSMLKAEYPAYELRVLFGCPGTKAQNRRIDLPTIAGKYADKIFYTEDDTGKDSFDAIVADVLPHLEKARVEYLIEPNREKAIKACFADIKQKTVIALLGKGRETWMKGKNGPEHYASDYVIGVSELKRYERFCVR